MGNILGPQLLMKVLGRSPIENFIHLFNDLFTFLFFI